MQPDRVRTSGIVALALLVGTFFVAQEVLIQLAAGRPIDVLDDIEFLLQFWVVWALLTPFVLRALRLGRSVDYMRRLARRILPDRAL